MGTIKSRALISMILLASIAILFGSVTNAENHGQINIIFDDDLNQPNSKIPTISESLKPKLNIKITRISNASENVYWESNITSLKNISMELPSGIYKLYVTNTSDNSLQEYNNDSQGFRIESGQIIPLEYKHAAGYILDAPWRIESSAENIALLAIAYDLLAPNINNISIYDANAGDAFIQSTNWNATQNISIGNMPYFFFFNINKSKFAVNNQKIGIKIRFDLTGAYDDIQGPIEIYSAEENLPAFGNWFYGDTHVHSKYTSNAWEFGAPIYATSEAISNIGLDWMTITDHSFDQTNLSEKWNDYIYDCNADERCLGAEEVSCDWGFMGGYSHYLAYNLRTFISGPEIYWGDTYTCETVIDTVNDAGFGYIAHPEHKDGLRWKWKNYSLPFTGLEVWNGIGEPWEQEREAAIKKWEEQLLLGTHIFISAGSDAHGDFNSALGKVRTGCYAGTFSKENILNAMKSGNCFMTDGPALIFDINEAIPGQSAIACKNETILLNILWATTGEFGKMSNITVISGVIGENSTASETFALDCGNGECYNHGREYEIRAKGDMFVYASAMTDKGKRAYTNPVWISMAEDADNDDVCDIDLGEDIPDYCLNAKGPGCNYGCPDNLPPEIGKIWWTTYKTTVSGIIDVGASFKDYALDEFGDKIMTSSCLALETAKIKIDNGSWIPMNSSLLTAFGSAPREYGDGRAGAFIDTANYTDGEHVLSIEVSDSSGNTAYSSRMIIFDNSPPKLSVFSPKNGAVYNDTKVALSYFAEDITLASCGYIYDGQSHTIPNCDDVHIYVDDGESAIDVWAEDALRQTTQRISFFVNETDPAIDIRDVSVLPHSAIIGDKIEIRAKIGGRSAIANASASISSQGRNWTVNLTGDGGDYGVLWDSSGKQRGGYFVSVAATDGNRTRVKSNADSFVLSEIVPKSAVSEKISTDKKRALISVGNSTVAVNTSKDVIDADFTGITYAENPVKTKPNLLESIGDFIELQVENIWSAITGAVLEITYTDEEVKAKGVKEDTLAIYYFNLTAFSWERVSGSYVDSIANKVRGFLPHFSLYAVYGEVEAKNISANISEQAAGPVHFSSSSPVRKDFEISAPSALYLVSGASSVFVVSVKNTGNLALDNVKITANDDEYISLGAEEKRVGVGEAAEFELTASAPEGAASQKVAARISASADGMKKEAYVMLFISKAKAASKPNVLLSAPVEGNASTAETHGEPRINTLPHADLSEASKMPKDPDMPPTGMFAAQEVMGQGYLIIGAIILFFAGFVWLAIRVNR